MKKFWLLAFLGLSLSHVACDLSSPNIAPHVEPAELPALRLLIIEETADRPKLPASQQSIFASVPLRTYLKAHCVREADGTAAFRMLDKDAELTGVWAATVREHPPRLYPWIYVTNGSKGLSGPLPLSVDETLKLLKTYAE